LGGDDAPKPRLGGAEIEPGDVLLLCSDGFWENLEPGEITQLAATPPSQWQKALEKAVQLAVQRGGQKADNTSVILTRYGEASAGGMLTQLWRFALILLLLASLSWLALNSALKEYFAPFGNALRQWREKAGTELESSSILNSTTISLPQGPANLGIKGPSPAPGQGINSLPLAPVTDPPPEAQAVGGAKEESAARAPSPTQEPPTLPAKP
jgi:hypothetical protein